MDADWFEWVRNIFSVSGVLLISRYIAIAVKDGVTRVWNDCVERDKRRLQMRAIEREYEYKLERDFIRRALANEAYTSRFQARRDDDTNSDKQDV